MNGHATGGHGTGGRATGARSSGARSKAHPARGRSGLALLVCAAALVQAGCADDDGRGDERIRVPELRVVDNDAMPLTLGARARIDARNRAAFERVPIERTVWVRTGEDDEERCLRLGSTGPASGGGSGGGPDDAPGNALGGEVGTLSGDRLDGPPEEGFPLESDAGSEALTTLAGLGSGSTLSLLVFWSVPGPVTDEGAPDPILLDAAEYAFTKDETPDTVSSDVIFLRVAEATSVDEDGVIVATPFDEARSCEAALGGRMLGPALDRDGDGLDSLLEIDLGLPGDAPVLGTVPVEGGLAALGRIDVVATVEEDPENVRGTVEPLAPTWRIVEAEDGGLRGERLRLPTGGGSDEREPSGPLDTNVAVLSDGTLMIEALLPAGFETEGRFLAMDAFRTDDLEPDGSGIAPTPIPCEIGTSSRGSLADALSLREEGRREGLYRDDPDGTGERVLARCNSEAEFGQAGAGSVRDDGTFTLFVTVSVFDRAEGSDPIESWRTLDGLEVFVYRPTTAAMPDVVPRTADR